MKKFLIILFVFSFVIMKIYANNTLPLVGKKIVIDPGHGGLDPGVVIDNLYEKDLNLDISLKLKTHLESLGASIIMTREGDYDLAKPNAIYRKKSDFNNRIDLINNSSSDAYISIHMNYLNDKSYFGPQVFYTKNNLNFAKVMQDNINQDREIKKVNTYMYDYLKIPGILIECGFLSNEEEKHLLQDYNYQDQLIQKIGNGLIEYYS